VDLLVLSGNYLKSAAFKKTAPARKGRILLIRHDGIGDYILFRNFIEVLRKSEKYKDYKITLLGNAAWKDLAEFLDKDFVDEFIWLDKRKFTVNIFYRYKKIKEITSNAYEILIHPFSREFLNADNDLAFLINADEKIGSVKNQKYPNIKKWHKKILERIYTELIPDQKGTIFEFYRNREFFENLLSEKIDIKKPFINVDLSNPANPDFDIAPPYAVFFIGASIEHRKWPAENFAKVARHLKLKHNYSIVLCGGKQELEDAVKFKKYCDNNNFSFIDTVGRIPLSDLLYIVKNASLVISNETMAPHIAVALYKPAVITVSNGEACYGHFVPYPPKISDKYSAIFHPEIEKNLEKYIKRADSYGYKCGYEDKFDISEIAPEAVIDKIDVILSKDIA